MSDLSLRPRSGGDAVLSVAIVDRGGDPDDRFVRFKPEVEDLADAAP